MRDRKRAVLVNDRQSPMEPVQSDPHRTAASGAGYREPHVLADQLPQRPQVIQLSDPPVQGLVHIRYIPRLPRMGHYQPTMLQVDDSSGLELPNPFGIP